MQGGIIAEVRCELKRLTPVNLLQKRSDLLRDIEALRTQLHFDSKHRAAVADVEGPADELDLERCPQVDIRACTAWQLPPAGEYSEHAAHQLPVSAALPVLCPRGAGAALPQRRTASLCGISLPASACISSACSTPAARLR